MSHITGPSPAGMAPASMQPAELMKHQPAEGDSMGTPVLTMDVSQATPGKDLEPAVAHAGPAVSLARLLGLRQDSGEMG